MLSRLHMAVLRRVRTEHLWTGLLITALLLVEVVGRRLPSELWDAGLVALGVGVAGLFLRWEGATARRWRRSAAHALFRRWSTLVERLSVTAGVDMRGTPPLPERSIPALRLGLWSLSGLFLTTVALQLWSPLALRETALQASYVVYLSLLTLVWGCLLLTIAVSSVLLFALVHDAFVRRHHRLRRAPGHGARRPLRRELAAHGVVVAVLAGLALSMPPWVPVALTCAVWLAPQALTWMPGSPELRYVWRAGDGRVHGISWQRFSSDSLVIALLIYLFLSLLAVGRGALGLDPGETGGREISSALGHVTAWVGGAALSAVMALIAKSIWLSRRRDPGRPCPTDVHVRDEVEGRDAARRILDAAGMHAHFAPAAPRPGAVPLVLRETMPPLPAQTPRWPLAVSLRTLATPEVQALIRRRDEIQRRRRLVAGFETLFKAAAARTFERGTGFWLAPHRWFTLGVARDEMEQESFEDDTMLDEVIGPPYAEVFDRSALNALHEIMSTLELDVIFVEDGLGFARFRRVLRILFEHHDVQRRRIDERHLGGLPGVRAVIHEFVIGEPHGRNGYPEPDYDEIGRARILHLFKDRGGDVDPFSAPSFDPGERHPAPVLV